MVLYILCVLTNEWWLVATIIVSYRIVPQLLKSSVLHLSIPASTQASGNHRSFFVTVITVLPFPECHTCCCSVLSCVQLFVTPWTAEHQASLSFTISQSLLKFTSIEMVTPSNHLILCRPLLLLPAIFPSIKVFSNESALRIRWPKYQSFSFSINPASEYSGVISFRVDWMDLLAVQGTLKSLLQHRSLTASILRCSAFFMVQLSHPYRLPEKL